MIDWRHKPFHCSLFNEKGNSCFQDHIVNEPPSMTQSPLRSNEAQIVFSHSSPADEIALFQSSNGFLQHATSLNPILAMAYGILRWWWMMEIKQELN